MEREMDEQITAQALRWHAASLRDDCDWQQFTEWLEASPLHRQAFDEVALLEDRIARHRGELARALPAAAPRGARLWRRAWVGGAIAAGMALVAVIIARPVLPFLPGATETYLAQAGAQRALSLRGGVQVTLAPGSSLRVAGRHDQNLQLEGSAWFDVPHDPSRTLEITAGDYRVRDIGTRFEVTHDAGQLKVSVSEGQVGVVLPGRAQPAPVNAGQRLLVAGDPPIAEYGEVAADDVAGWRTGRLVFRNEPLSMVASEVGRHAGVTVTVDTSLAQRRFSGVLPIGDGSQLVEDLGGILALRAQRTGSVVHLSAAGPEPAGR